MKKVLSLILAVILIISAVPMGAFTISVGAETATSGTTGDCTWSLDGTILTISGEGAMADYSYSNSAPWGTDVTKVVIEDSVTNIGDWAFRDFEDLTSITIPNSVTSIGYRAFYGCELLKRIELPENISVIDSYTFERSGLKAIYIPAGFTSISNNAFSNTDINYVYYGGDEENKNNINITSGNDALDNAVWIYEQSGLPNHKYDNRCDNVCNLCEEIRVAPNHINSYICNNADCNYTRIVTKEDLQVIMDAIPNTLYLDITEAECQNAREAIYSQIGKILEEQSFKYEYNDVEIYLNAITKEGYDIKLTVYKEEYKDTIFCKNICISSVNTALEHYNDSYSISQNVNLTYKDTDKYTLNYIKNLKLKSPRYYIIDIDKLISGYSIFAATDKYYFEQIGDDSIVINTYAYAGNGGGVNQSAHGVFVDIYKYNILYDIREMGTEYTVPLITIPYDMAYDVAYDYVVDKITELYDEFGKNITGIEKVENIYGKEVVDGYAVYSNFTYDNVGYVIIKKVHSGWNLLHGVWYYFNENGTKTTGWQNIGAWYFFNAYGEMQIGWQNLGGTWYYLNSLGAMQTGWLNDGGTWYYFSGSGAMVTGWTAIGGIWYYMDGSGAMVTDWASIDGNWYYFNTSGAMLTGWANIGGTWYYFGGSGAMVTGWQWIDGAWYYFYPGGNMAANCYVDGYWLSASGAMA